MFMGSNIVTISWKLTETGIVFSDLSFMMRYSSTKTSGLSDRFPGSDSVLECWTRHGRSVNDLWSYSGKMSGG
jgi:hypothetical protein